jgi:hypothetical protein
MLAEFGLVIAVINSTGGKETPYHVDCFPDAWVMIDDNDPVPIMVPILFSGSDIHDAGHYSGPIIIPDETPDVLKLDTNFQYINGTLEERNAYLERGKKNAIDIILQSKADGFLSETFPKIDLLPKLIKESMKVPAGEGRLTVHEPTTNGGPATIIVESLSAVEEFRRRIGDTSQYAFRSIFPAPPQPIVGLEFGEDGEKILTVRDTKKLPEEHSPLKNQIVNTQFAENSDPLQFLALALGNTIVEKISIHDRMAFDIQYTCDILQGMFCNNMLPGALMIA